MSDKFWGCVGDEFFRFWRLSFQLLLSAILTFTEVTTHFFFLGGGGPGEGRTRESMGYPRTCQRRVTSNMLPTSFIPFL